MNELFDIQENLKKLPDKPGVYIHKDRLGQIIYVGKAISLKNRVRQYFQSQRNMPPKVRAMVSNIGEFEYITTNTETEALILECTLIKKYMPKYNILLRDDKTYPYLKLTMDEDFPRLVKTRKTEKDGGRYFGPYTDVGAVNTIHDLMNNLFSLKRCNTKSFPKNAKPCLNYHINGCRGICCGKVDKEQYREVIDRVTEFLNGKTKPLIDTLTKEMLEASEKLDFEKAAAIRDNINSVKRVTEKQRVVLLGMKDLDIVLSVSTKNKDYAVIFYVREGKLSGREEFVMDTGLYGEWGTGKKESLVAEFIKQHYCDNPNVPREIIVEKPLSEQGILEKYLEEQSGHYVKIHMPYRGEKRDLLMLAQKDSVEMVKMIDQRENNRIARQVTIASEIEKIVDEINGEEQHIETVDFSGKKEKQRGIRQYRVEAYDISNTNGVDSVGAMVVFDGLKPNRKAYRRFRIKTVQGSNDYGSMQEVVYRRLRRALSGDLAFSPLPDVIFLDGGKGQVSAVQQILNALGVSIPLVGMAKDDKHRTRALVYLPFGSEEYKEIKLKEHPLLFGYVGNVQEEVHRFAIEYHKGLRGRKIQGSVLDEITGIGAKKRNALLTHFGSTKEIFKATKEQLREVDGISEKNAESILEFVKNMTK